MTNMNITWKTIEERVSCRAYQARIPEQETIDRLQQAVEQINEESGLKVQLMVTKDQSNMLKLSSTMFDGPVYVYAAMIGGKDELSAEKIGYYGEQLVLLAASMGLGTCWVAGTYEPKSVTTVIPEDMKLWDVMPIGYATDKTPVKQKLIRAGIRARDRKLEQFLESDKPLQELPEWMRKAVEAVKLGPSAVNQQPVNIVYKDGVISARLWKNARGLSFNDLGIAKCQFELAAAAYGVHGSWAWGDGGVFTVQE